MKTLPVPSLICLLALSRAMVAPLAGWPGCRGDGTGLSTETKLPFEWSDSKNVRWRVPVPGYGWSCPVIAGNQIFLTTDTTFAFTLAQAHKDHAEAEKKGEPKKNEP